MTAAEVAKYTRMNVQTIYRKARNGELHCYRLGSAVRFKREEIELAMGGEINANNDETRRRSNLAG